ncbi:MAG: AbrB/MazE/SpoVT family DNA-binding domain-containing protein [Candidatus Omnitrophota bacterium]
MTITMTAKHQVTIPKKITDVLRLGKGTMFNIVVSRDRIELIPLETKEKVFSDEEYKKLEMLSIKEKGAEKQATKKFIDNLKKGKS